MFDDFILTIVFASIPVLELDTCRIVCTAWNKVCGSNELWLQKYIAEAHVSNTQPNPLDTNWRRQCFNRFFRNEKLAILWNNYKNTQNDKYLEQIEQVATASCETYYNWKWDFREEPLMFIDKLAFSSASGGDKTSRQVYTRRLIYNGTIYSPTALAFARFAFEFTLFYECTFTGVAISAKAVVLFNGASKAEHLFDNITETQAGRLTSRDEEDEGSEEYVEVNREEPKEYSYDYNYYLRPLKGPCEKLVNLMNSEMTPTELVTFLGKTFIHTLSKEHLCPRRMFAKTKLLKSSHAKQLYTMSECINAIVANYGDNPEYLRRISELARIELRMKEIHIKADQAQLSPAVLHLLKHTQILSYQSRYGYGPIGVKLSRNASASFNCYGNAHYCEFLLSMPDHKPIHLVAEIQDCISLSVNRVRRSIFAEVVKQGKKYQLGRRWEVGRQFEQRTQRSKQLKNGSLLDIVTELKVDGLQKINFIEYMLLFSSDMFSLNALTKDGEKQVSTKFDRKTLDAHMAKIALAEKKIAEEVQWDGQGYERNALEQEELGNETGDEEEEEEGEDEDDEEEDEKLKNAEESSDWCCSAEEDTSEEDELFTGGKPKRKRSPQRKSTTFPKRSKVE